MDIKEVINTKMVDNDANAETIKDYLRAILSNLWQEKESFSGKRPCGNSGWEYYLYDSLVLSGHIDGEVEDGEIIERDIEAGDEVICLCIEYVFDK